MGDIVPRDTLAKQGVKAVGGLAGGIGLLVLNTIGSLPVVGTLIGAAVALAGVAITRSKGDRTAGIVITVAGGAALLSSLGILGGLSGTVLLFGGIGLLGVGLYSGYQFITNMRKRM